MTDLDTELTGQQPSIDSTGSDPANAADTGYVMTVDGDLVPALRTMLDNIEKVDINDWGQSYTNAAITYRLLQQGADTRTSTGIRTDLDEAISDYKAAVKARYAADARRRIAADDGVNRARTNKLALDAMTAFEAETAARNTLKAKHDAFSASVSHDPARQDAMAMAWSTFLNKGRDEKSIVSEVDGLLAVPDSFDAELARAKNRLAAEKHATADARKVLQDSVEKLRELLKQAQLPDSNPDSLTEKKRKANKKLDEATATLAKARQDRVAKIKRAVKKSVKASTRANAIKKIDRHIAKLERDVSAASTEVVKAEPAAVIHSAMTDVLKRMSADSPTRAYMSSLLTASKTATLEANYEAIAARVTANATALANPGSKVESIITVEAGPALEALGVARLRVSAVAARRLVTERLANGKFKATWEDSAGMKIGVKVGFEADVNTGVAMANATAMSTIGGDRTYDSLAALAQAESRRFMAFAAGSAMNGTTAENDVALLQQRQQLLILNRANSKSLDSHLAKIGAYAAMNAARPGQPEDPADVGSRRLKVYKPDNSGAVRTSMSAITASVDGKIMFQLGDPLIGGGLAKGMGIGVGGSAAVKVQGKTEYKRLSFLDDIKDETVQRLHLSENADQFAFTIRVEDNNEENQAKYKYVSLSGKGAVDQLDALEQQLKLLGAREADLDGQRTFGPLTEEHQAELDGIKGVRTGLQQQLRKSLEALRVEYDHYVEVANGLVNGTIPKKQAASTHGRLLKERGLKLGRTAEYVRAVSVQFAVTRRLFEDSYGVRADGKSKVPPKDKELLETFSEDLAVPRMKLSQKYLEKVFGKEAVGDSAAVVTLTGAASFAVAGTGTGLSQSADSKEQAKTKPAGLQFTASWANERKKVPGQLIADSSHTIVLDGSFFSQNAIAGKGTGILKPDETFVAGLVGKLLSVRSFGTRSENLADQAHLAAELGDAVNMAISTGAGTLQLDFTVKEGKWRLKTAAAIERRNRKTGIGASIPTGTPINVALSIMAERNRTKVLAVYRGANTLSGITDLYRGTLARQADETDTAPEDSAWSEDYAGKSGLLSRMVDQLVADDRDRVRTKDNRTMLQLMDGIVNGEVLKGTNKNRVLAEVSGVDDKEPISRGLSNDLIDWLLDMNKNVAKADSPEVNPAKNFIAKYKSLRDTLRTGSAAAKAEAKQQMAKEFSTLIQAKSKDEDDKFDEKFQQRRGFTRQRLNDYVAREIATKFSELADRTKATDRWAKQPSTSLAVLRKQAMKNYLKRKKDKTLSQEDLELLKEVLALDHAARSLDDLTLFNDEADKNKLIANVGTTLTKMMDQPKVYINELIDGELSEDKDGKLILTPVVKKGHANKVSKSMLTEAVNKAIRDLKIDGVVKLKDSTVVGPGRAQLEDDAGNQRPWSKKHYNKEAEREFRKKRLAKAGLTRSVGSSSPGRSLTKSRNFDIAKSIQLVMEEEAKKKARQRGNTSRRANQLSTN